ncbi:MAG TPA: superoxide dismutase family protein [Longimicrobiales bacterium]
MRGPTLLAIALTLTAAASLSAQERLTARADLIDARGRKVGEATLHETPNSGVHIELDVSGLRAGAIHGFHIHETGRCETPTFESAGGHYAPRGREHGILNADGPHAGDLLNLHVPASGRVHVEQLAPRVTLRAGARNTLFDDDGSALVIHADADDYRSQPSGESGDRIVCGVIRR